MLIPTNAVKSWWNDSWTSTQGIGKYVGGGNGFGGAMLRGGNWIEGVAAGVFQVALNTGPSSSGGTLGFRCVFVPRS